MGRSIQRLRWLASGALIAVFALELLLRQLPVSMGTHRSLAFDRWPLEYTVPRSEYHYSIGWAMRNPHAGVSNNYGHIAPFDFEPRSGPVLVLGDSYVESLMNDYADTLQARLGRMLGAPQSVYGMGVSGASASGYVGLARMSRAEFAPAAAVVLVSDGDFSESIQRATGSHWLREDGSGSLELAYEPLTGVPLSTRIRNILGDSSLHRYLQINLRFDPAELLKNLGSARSGVARRSEQVVASTRAITMQRRVVDWFLEQMPTSLDLEPACIVLLFDSDRYALYDRALASVPKDSPATRAYAIEKARALGFAVIDLAPVFSELYARDRLRFDHYPIDRHWNALGHEVAATETMRLLSLNPKGCSADGSILSRVRRAANKIE